MCTLIWSGRGLSKDRKIFKLIHTYTHHTRILGYEIYIHSKANDYVTDLDNIVRKMIT